ncbi:TPA: multicopper oxidase domain-containing protein [Legionella pneumophila]|nr:multicopper oxidase domain-containing protein [Legionella pneumophila]HBC0468767.1 multicopper oxidase family protein [Legionella pneumophila]HDV6632913.1 multicopper oxidase family protein [Legionella pneumophila]
MTNTTDFYRPTPLAEARWKRILINNIKVRTLSKISFFILIVTIMITPFKPSYATDSKRKPTVITVSEEEFQVDGKGEKTKEFKLTFTHPDGTKDNKGYFANKGDMFHVLVENKSASPITLHWHGLIVPSDQDGVPNVSQILIQPGQNKLFNYRLLQAGTYWMHSHQKFQEQKQLSAPLIIYDKDDPYKDLQEVILFLEDFTYKDPLLIFDQLRNAKMGMKKMDAGNDLNDVNYDAFLANKKTLAAPDVISVQPLKKVRLRIINASSSTNFKIDTGKLSATLIAVDGENIEPIMDNSFPIGVGNRMDLIVEIPSTGGAFPIKALAEGTNKQTGLILKTANTPEPTLSPNTNKKMGRVNYYELEKKLKGKNTLVSKKINSRLHYVLDGQMKGYIWTMNNESWPDVTPKVIHFGDRVEMIYENKSSMSHPMHFHGHVFQVTEIDGQPLNGTMRDTLLVQPHSTVKVQFDALNPGIWANHCHNLYHLNAGMFTTFEYQHYPKPDFYLKTIGQSKSKN